MSAGCAEFERALGRTPSGAEESAAGTPGLHQHLLACAACRSRLRHAIGAGRALLALRETAPPTRRFFAELEAAVVGSIEGSQPRRRFQRRVVAAVAAVALFAFGLNLAGHSGAPKRSRLADFPPLSIPEPFLFDPSSLTMPVDANAFRGLRGRALLERMLEESLRRRQRELGEADPIPATHGPR